MLNGIGDGPLRCHSGIRVLPTEGICVSSTSFEF